MSFGVEDLIACYARGVFPMAEDRDDPRMFLVDPELRGVLPLDRLHVPRRLARTVRADLFEVRTDTTFAGVVRACATPTPGRTTTWINASIEYLYGELFERGLAHSVECWVDGALVGGLYGVSLGGAFFGESMFSTRRDASKVALVHLAARLKVGGYSLLDTQFLTDHLSQFGVEEITRATYRRRLAAALRLTGDFGRLDQVLAGAAGAALGGAGVDAAGGAAAVVDSGGAAGAGVLQAISHTS